MTVHREIRWRAHASAQAVEAAPAITASRISVKRLIIQRFERGLGAHLAALMADTRFKLWRLTHREGSYADFYAHVIAARLARGGSHRTLGPRDYWTELLPLGAGSRDPSDFRARGKEYFDWFLSRNLRRDMMCIDYGCGSLRVGQHFIEYLDTGGYLGLDIIDRFYRDGMSMMEGRVVLRHQPRFLIIDAETLMRAREARPDLIFSTSVLQHVPPDEVAVFFANIIGLMHKDSVAIIHFRAAMTTARIAASTWTHRPVSLITTISCIDPSMHTRMEDGPTAADARYYRAVLVLSRNPASLRQWFTRPAPKLPSVSQRGPHDVRPSLPHIHLSRHDGAIANDSRSDTL